MARLSTLLREISPPPSRRGSAVPEHHDALAVEERPVARLYKEISRPPSLAAVEAGKADVRDHLTFFSERLRAFARPSAGPRISFQDYEDLFQRNQHAHGCHFVVHQHDHPISGVHYDLRLQFSQTSCISFAIPYGLPGNPNSKRPNRMAIETRVHNLWNNLIETASHATGSLLIWETGEYEVLPRAERRQAMTDDERSGPDDSDEFAGLSPSERLYRAFQQRHIRLRLHGVRLPAGYTVSLRLPAANDRRVQTRKPRRKRRRLDTAGAERSAQGDVVETESESEVVGAADELLAVDGVADAAAAAAAAAAASDGDDNDHDATIRKTNAYTGATNSIGSVHQRHWFLTLDRQRSGFRKARTGDRRKQWDGGWDRFFVRGRDYERSVLTGRTAGEVMADEGVNGFVGRKMWRAIVE